MKNSHKRTIRTSLIIAAAVILAYSSAVNAQTYTALEPLPCIPGGGVTCATNGELQETFSFQNYVQYIFNLIIAIAAAASVFMIVFGGLQYMTTDSWSGKSAGLEKARNAVYGLLLVLASYLILRTIDPRLVAIPATLVPPLKIAYQNTTASILSGGLSDPAVQQFLADDAEARQRVTEARSNLENLQQGMPDIEREIVGIAQASGFPAANSARNICRPGGIVDSVPDLRAPCQHLEVVKNEIAVSQFTIANESAKALIAGKIKECLSLTTFSLTDCQTRVQAAFTVGKSRIDDISRSTGWQFDTQELADYAEYTKATLGFYNELQQAKIVDSGSITPLSSILPGGRLVAVITNTAANILRANPARIADRITAIYNAASIRDEALKEQLRQQVLAIRLKLGLTN